MISKSHVQYALFVLGILFSVILVVSIPEFYHQGDMHRFWEWAHYWSENWKDIYLNCKGCNYPIIGTFSSAGLLSILGNGNYQNAVFSFRLLLGLIDGLNVLLIFWLLKQFSINNAALWAGIIGILPSSWAGGALWGQIDGISQLFILVALVWIVRSNLGHQVSKSNFRIYLAISSVMLSWIILTKQIAIFSFFSIGFLLTANVFFFSRKWSQFATDSLLMIAFFIFSIILWDSFLNLKEPYFSHLHYIWETGSSHGDVISLNGFNIWMFLGRNMRSSSHIPFFFNNVTNSHVLLLFTPYIAGVFFFLVFNSISSLSLLLFLRNQFLSGERFLNREILLNFIFYLALVNLSFNVLLTGTHERYLYHFYPFMILACLGLRKYTKLFSNNIIYIVVFGASLYGLFVLGILSNRAASLGYTTHWVLGIFHFGLLCYLFLIFLKYRKFNKSVRFLLEA